ncbi:MAG: excinuclease ABC subunit UvrB [Candidatus Krumholzibacteria bacterium]|nr:excinuclease ABC subunit UvrB [Candidatus Krumholzibacteria bacterium]MDP6669228.1 excinuclease ABC subunit UvrB [Candidatus Krumholzibacteria bacterium]MDP6796471.1 excinuclease ABC subunit UvrB [Candidatus Krumholzibacteria bacterium]MDP7021601.1 excinuclease ABC subunit UvrB [Candidatus Krumholzibacteria bacterium]
MPRFKLHAPYPPRGDQPKAIEGLSESVLSGRKYQTLLGVTGSGKTFTMAKVIEKTGLPALVISHNKTLAAQLYGEFRAFFPENAVEFFISYYDYYQPEAFIPASGTYIEKDASVNEEIDRLRMSATSQLLMRDDVIVIASVSAIYGLGNPEEFRRMVLPLRVGDSQGRPSILRKLVDMQYTRNDVNFHRGCFRVHGDLIEIYPSYEDSSYRVELFGDEIESLERVDPLTGKPLEELQEFTLFPAHHFVTGSERMQKAIGEVGKDLEIRLNELRQENLQAEVQRLSNRTRYDMEMMREMGFCPGIENYSRYLDGRKAGERPLCLLDYFPEDYLVFIDESHVTVPQVRGMYNGDRNRKTTLVNHGFRLPSALDNRPLHFGEFESLLPRAVFVSATPSDYELKQSEGAVFEQVIRPTGLLDPEIEIRPSKGQVDDLLAEIRIRAEKKERTLVTTLTKRMSEDLSDYLSQAGLKVAWLHSDIKALERVAILRKLRLGELDVLVGVNLLREGLDLPEVSLVAVLDADSEGFLRSHTSLIQTAGRAARHESGKVILYADRETNSIRLSVEETRRRRELQEDYNRKHGIQPRGIRKSQEDIEAQTRIGERKGDGGQAHRVAARFGHLSVGEKITELEKEMRREAEARRFESAASLRDLIEELKLQLAEDGRQDEGSLV